MNARAKFASQAAPELLEGMRAIAAEEGRQFQSVLEDAMRAYVEAKRGGRPRAHVQEHLKASLARNAELYGKLAE